MPTEKFRNLPPDQKLIWNNRLRRTERRQLLLSLAERIRAPTPDTSGRGLDSER